MTTSRKSFHPIDTHVGKRLRIRRKMLSLSQTMLGESIGLTFQQIQKYERGANRIGASRLFELSEVLDVPVSYFFDDLPADIAQATSPDARETGDLGTLTEDALFEPVSVDLLRAYSSIDDPQTRKSMFNLAKALAKDTPLADSTPKSPDQRRKRSA
ncbi:MAG: helix-turn-helix transcriptional regulator [Alphaproteobacteria bacterium]